MDALPSAGATGCAGLIETSPQTVSAASRLKNLKTGLKKGGDGVPGKGRAAVPRADKPGAEPNWLQYRRFEAVPSPQERVCPGINQSKMNALQIKL